MTGRLEGISGNKFTPLIMIWPLFISVLGLALCAWSALGNIMDFCITSGCELNQDMTLGGISLWWYGAVAFCILTIVSLSGRPWLGVAAAGFCVILDIVLLLLMLVTSPCISCLVVGLLFLLTYIAFRHTGRRLEAPSRSILVTIWMIIFIANSGVILRDSLGTWSIYGAKNPLISVYFSPSCPSCQVAVNVLVSNKDAAFYPILEKEEDFVAIAHIVNSVNKGESLAKALEQAKNIQNHNLGFFEALHLHFYLLRNKAKVLLSGSDVVPFIEYKGLPASLNVAPASSNSAEQKKINKPKQIQQTPSIPMKQEISTPLASPDSTTSLPSQGDVSSANTYEPMETLESMDPINIQPNANALDAELPIDTGIAGSCGGATQEPCPE